MSGGGKEACAAIRASPAPRPGLFGTLAAVGAFFALGSSRIGVGDAATLGATAPVFVALLSRPLLGERVGAHVSLAVTLAFTGVIAVVRPSFEIAATGLLTADRGSSSDYLCCMALPAPRLPGLDYHPEVACRHLSDADPKLGELIERAGPFLLEPEPTQSLFAALLESIVYQQLSGKAAATILGRVCALYHPRRFPRPSDILATAPERLRAAGLSNGKMLAVKDLAAKTMDGTVPSMLRVRRMADDEIVERLTTVRGVGRWTVEMLLLFRLGRPDVLPVGDLGVRKGFARTFGRRALKDPAVMVRRAEHWRPYRSVASWYMWRALEL